MKKIICLILTALFLCGCTPLKDEFSSVDTYSGYATKILEFIPAENWDFAFSDGTVNLHTGDSHAGFTLSRLLYRPDETGNHSVRANFSCDVTASGTIVYNKGGVYNNLIKFYPSDITAFPKIANDANNIVWFVILEDNDPLAQLGITPDSAAETAVTVQISDFSIHYSQHDTVNYITINLKNQ